MFAVIDRYSQRNLKFHLGFCSQWSKRGIDHRVESCFFHTRLQSFAINLLMICASKNNAERDTPSERVSFHFVITIELLY